MAFVGSTTPLAAGPAAAGVWTSEIRLTDRYDSVAGIAFADQAGTLSVQQSLDGTNWDFKAPDVAVVANTGKDFNVTLVAPYWRLVYTNGAAIQTVFRLAARAIAAGDS